MFDVCEGCGEEVEVNEAGFCIACVGGELLESPMTEGVDLFGPGAPCEKKDLDHCPTCGRWISDVDPNGCEAPDAQRWCRNHSPAPNGWNIMTNEPL